MSHREEQEEAGPKALPTQCSRQPKGVSVERGRPKWRPCQLNNQDAQGDGHHHHQHQHHHHYHQQSHHQQQQPGTGRIPPRRSRRHAPGHGQHRVSDSKEGQPRPGLVRYRQNGERGHQHSNRQQSRVGYGNTMVQQQLDIPQTDHTVDAVDAVDAVSPEESSQELLTPPSQDEPSPSPQEVSEQDGGSPGLHSSSSTESSLHAHLDQMENPQPEREKMEVRQGCRDEWQPDKKQHEDTDSEERKPHQVHQGSVASSAGSKETMHAHNRRAGPIRVDIPPCAASPPHSLQLDQTQPQPFSGPLRGYSSEPQLSPIHFSSTTPLNTGPRSECRACTQSCEEPLSDSSPEACSDPCSQPNSKSCPRHVQTIPTKAHEEVCAGPVDEHYHKHSEEQQGFEESLDVPCSQLSPWPEQQGEPNQPVPVDSRLHRYNQHEAGCPERGSTKHRKDTSSSNSFIQDGRAQDPREEYPDVGPATPGLDGGESREGSYVEAPPPALTLGSASPPLKADGNAISLVIRDIKDAIEEVKTKAVCSPYTPDPPTQPVWVMRQDTSPVEEHPLQDDLQTPHSSVSHCMTPGADSTSPIGAESSQTQGFQDRDVSLSFPPAEELKRNLAAFPTYVDGPCDPEDLIDGIIFAASFLGSTQLLSERMPSKSGRMRQAQEAISRVRDTEADDPLSATEVDLFLSIQQIKVLSADTQEIIMDHPLRTISYIADIGNTVVLMARGKTVRSHSAQDQLGSADSHLPSPVEHPQYRMVCHVFESEDAQLIAQSIGQAFSVAYQEFLRANGIDPEDLNQREYSDLLSTQDMYNDDLIHFSKSENCRDVHIEKQKGEILGVVIVESGWGSILPTVIIASLMHSGPAAKSGRLNIGDQIMTVNGTSLVGLPLSTCQSIIKGLKSQSRIKMNIVRCPPVTMVIIRRPDLRYQLGFSVQNGIICSLMRGGIAERGGVRVGHRIIEINGQSVVATPHEKIVHLLSNAVGEIHMKTMPAAMYRLLTAQEQPIYI